MSNGKQSDRRWGSSQKLGWRISSMLILVLVGSLLVDSLLSDMSSIVNQLLPEPIRIALFSTLVGIAILAGSNVILHEYKKIKSI
jgi:hypothetical protein